MRRSQSTATGLLATLPARSVNFDVERLDELARRSDWNVDDYAQLLPPELPGAPLAGGSWEIACRLSREYVFADPRLVRAMYHYDLPLEGRDIVLEARFSGLTFLLAVRAAQVEDESTAIDGRPVRRSAWSYRTLEGHLERGQMDYEVRKWLDTGEVEFRIHVVSRAAKIPDLVTRWGFLVFGRRLQVRFAKRSARRMRALVEAELGRGPHPRGARDAAGRVRRVIVAA